ncbi:MAG: pyrroloquinoline quinone biosynthesis protein PqqB [Acidobacteriota bacterium]|nr:MAG: pyrroloquinoline quinone biosynthesis protein PqqB [Acidobacteriota bacterium]
MKRTFALFIALTAFSAFGLAADPYVVVLGVGQDAGVPQMGCESPFCKEAWKDPSKREMVSSIAIVDPDTGERWIFDATPDLPEQFQLLKEITGDRSNALDGIFLTHAHMGHYTGLMYLGFESMNAKEVPVFAMPRMKRYLETNGPWSQLVSFKNISIKELVKDKPSKLNGRISVTPFLVPHRDEYSETVGFRITSNGFNVLFIPDIDKWERWDRKLEDEVRKNDLLFVDATFFKDGEIPRPMSEVLHPFVEETMALLKDLPASERSKIHFIHFNHSNPLVQRSKEAIGEVESSGFRIARTGMTIPLENRGN